jgi:hypothetical protein
MFDDVWVDPLGVWANPNGVEESGTPEALDALPEA